MLQEQRSDLLRHYQEQLEHAEQLKRRIGQLSSTDPVQFQATSEYFTSRLFDLHIPLLTRSMGQTATSKPCANKL